jgi:hypothetical protein
MVFPAIKLNQLYSLNLYDGLNIIFEDLAMLNMKVLEEVVTTKTLGNIQIVNNCLSINTVEKSITIVGHKLNMGTYIIGNNKMGDIHIMKYKCSDKDILTAIEYLYHMYKNLV